MREILFRGKRLNDGKWVKGGILHQTDFYGDEVDRYFVIDGKTTLDYDIGSPEEVIEKTVGQFTGLKDKNGAMIFEDDIVAFEDAEADYEGYHDNVFVNRGIIIYDEHSMRFCITNRQTVEMEDLVEYDIEVIGNIFDNPELLDQ